jgi:hypothetical protein
MIGREALKPHEGSSYELARTGSCHGHQERTTAEPSKMIIKSSRRSDRHRPNRHQQYRHLQCNIIISSAPSIERSFFRHISTIIWPEPLFRSLELIVSIG